MGEIVLAAKVSHVPSLLLSERQGHPVYGTRKEALAALRELGRRATERKAARKLRREHHEEWDHATATGNPDEDWDADA